MIILDDGILLSSNEAMNAPVALSNKGNGILLPHNAVDKAAQKCKDIWYDAKSERAVRCLLGSSAKNMVCRPLAEFGKEFVQAACNDKIIKMTQNGGNDSPARKILALLVNRAIVSTGHRIERAQVDAVFRRENIIKYINIESNYSDMLISHVASITFDNKKHKKYKNVILPVTCIAKASDALWNNGYIIKDLGIAWHNHGIILGEMEIYATPYTRGANTTEAKNLVEEAIGMKTWLVEEVIQD